jgi:4-hydroxy-2-oxoheptanedioate aldolase
MFRPNLLKRRIAAGEALFGAWVETGSATVTEILSWQGFDFLLLDLEHGQGDIADAIAMLRAAAPSGTPCIVRVPSADAVFLKRILDAGADSIMIPGIESAAEAAAVVQACRYPPQGRRGYAAPVVRASGYGATADYVRQANDNLLLIAQIESASAVAQAGAIAAVEGIDVPFIGVNDLAGSIGLLEQLDRAEVRGLVTDAEAAIRRTGKPMGTVPSAGATWQDLFGAGYRLVPVALDVSLLRDGARAMAQAVAQFRGERPGSAAVAQYS